jgi:hypothetical protein
MSDVWTIERHLEAGVDEDFAQWIADAYDQVGCGNRLAAG